MKKLHNRPIDPLQPPPGSFDHMMKSARGRRRRQAMAVVSSAAALVLVAGGAFALGNAVGRTDNVVTNAVADRGSSEAASSSQPASSARATPSPHKRHKKHAKKQPAVDHPAKQVVPPASTTTVTATATATRNASATPIIHLRGQVTDPEGNPLSGVYVLPGFPDTAAFAPHNGAFTQTDEHGEFDIPCPRSPVYLATWPLNRPITTYGTGADYAPAWFAAPEGNPGSVVPTCGRARKTTVLQPISTTVTGRVGLTPDSGTCALGKTFTVGIWLGGNKSRSIRMNGLTLDPTRTFEFHGLPEGTHTLNAGGNETSITVKNGVAVTQDALFTCHGPPASPTPTPTPTDTTVPSPSTSPPTPPTTTP
jgi:hypothetical protein